MKVFVFGSNLAGIHGAGSAHHAYNNYGAEWGVGVGPTGKCYAIPTKDKNIESMTLEEIEPYVKDFIDYAKNHPSDTFQVVAIGCGLAGFKPHDIAPMFKDYPPNCILPPEFENLITC